MQQTVELLSKKLELLGAEKHGAFGVDCETYHTAAAISSQGGRRGAERSGAVPAVGAAPCVRPSPRLAAC